MLKKEILEEIITKLCPDDTLTRVSHIRLRNVRNLNSPQYMIRTMSGPSELWRMRKQFALQMASVSFMTYIFCLASRLPGRFYLSRSTGQITMSELLPGKPFVLLAS